MKKRIYWTMNLVSLVLLLLTSINLTIAWISDSNGQFIDISGESIGGFFAGGDGTKETPYIITNRQHMYNLSWLQYRGRFNDTTTTDDTTNLDKQFYFQVNNDIDMHSMVLPPIGTKENPFVGVFDGGGHKISNFSSTNNQASLTNIPQGVSFNSYFVGLFGIIGDYEGLYANVASGESEDSTAYVPEVSNFYIDNYSVIVDSGSALTGILAGYINGSVSKIGIHYANINYLSAVSALSADVSPTNADYTAVSKYTLFGDYASASIEWEEKPGGGDDFGASMDMLQLDKRLTYMYNSDDPNKFNFYPVSGQFNEFGSDNSTYLGNGTYLPLMVSNDITEDYYKDEANDSEIISEKNPGYVTGGRPDSGDNPAIRVSSKSISTAMKQAAPTKSDGVYTDVQLITKRSSTSGADLDASLTDYYGSSTHFKRVKTQLLALMNNGSDRLHGIRWASQQLDTNNIKFKIDVNIWNQTYSNYEIIGNALTFIPKNDGVVTLVACSWFNNSNQSTFNLYKVTRNEDYTVSTVEQITNVYLTPDGEYLFNTYTVPDGSTEVFNSGWMSELSHHKCYYYEIPVEGMQEYVIGMANDNGAYLVYLDIGANASGDSDSSETIGTIESVDFVYETSTGFSDFSDLSSVTFSLGAPSEAVVIFFKRKETLGVLYYKTNTALTVTPEGTGANGEATSESCDAKSSS